MHYSYIIYIIPFISAFIGWFVGWLAIKILFYPATPKQFLGIKLQGVFPKNKNQLALNLGKLANEELLPILNNIETKVADPASIDKVMPFVEKHIDHFLRVKLAEKMPVISMFIGESTISELKSVFIEELKTLFPEMMGVYMANIQNDINLENIIITKVASISSDKLEGILKSNFKKELTYLGIVLSIVGFLIGLLQLSLVLISG